MSDSPVRRLAERQLAAYNVADVDAFCACYAPDVSVLDADGRETLRGLAAFRQRYERLFAEWTDVRAEVTSRVACGDHAVDHERWSRVDRASGQRREGELLVRYTARDGLIAVVQFL